MITIFDSLEKIPKNIKYVKDNDAYFDAKSKLLDTDLVRFILETIDNAKYVSESTFLGRNIKSGNLNKMYLSTGTKVLLNIINNSNVCFDVIECGVNVLDLIPYISNKVEGYIFWRDCLYPFADNFDCDIYFNGKRYSKVFDFMLAVSERGN